MGTAGQPKKINKKMNRLKFLIFLVISLVLFSCSKDFSSESGTNNFKSKNFGTNFRSSTIKNNDYVDYMDVNIISISNNTLSIHNIGELHNALLDYQWQYIKANPVIPEGLTPSAFFEILYSGFFNNLGINAEFIFEPMNSQLILNESSDYMGFLSSISNNSNLYQELIRMINKNTEELLSCTISDETFILKLEEIRIISESLIQDSEKFNIQVTIEVALSSLDYWKNNLDEYLKDVDKFITLNSSKFNINKEPNAQGKPKIDYKDMAEADIAGAWTMGKWGFVAGGGPIGAISCGVVGGAGASAINVIWQRLWD